MSANIFFHKVSIKTENLCFASATFNVQVQFIIQLWNINSEIKYDRATLLLLLSDVNRIPKSGISELPAHAILAKPERPLLLSSP